MTNTLARQGLVILFKVAIGILPYTGISASMHVIRSQIFQQTIQVQTI